MFPNTTPQHLQPTSHQGGITIRSIQSPTINNDPILIRRDVYEQLDELYHTAAEILREQGKVVIIESDGSPSPHLSEVRSL